MGEAVTAPTSAPLAAPGGPIALVELLDRDGTVRQTWTVPHWPLRIGRALDNDIVLGDPHLAAHHLLIEPDEHGLVLNVADTVNGVQLGKRRLASGERAPLAADGDPLELGLGRTRLRLRLPGHTLAPELALAPQGALQRKVRSAAIATLALLGGVVFVGYLANDPDTFGRATGSLVLGVIVGAALWCGAWAMLSKIFTRQSHFGWHLRVFLYTALALLALDALPPLLAFSFSWPWATDFAFAPEIAVVAAALYFHLLAVEPARHRLLKLAAVACGVVGIALTLWFNVQRSDLYGDELYMSHLFPPALRLAKPVPPDTLVNALNPLKATLDRKAKEAGADDGGPRGEED